MKPFRSPLITKAPSSAQPDDIEAVERPPKRRRISSDGNDSTKLQHPVTALRVAEGLPPSRSPLYPVRTTSVKTNGKTEVSDGIESHYVVLWCVFLLG